MPDNSTTTNIKTIESMAKKIATEVFIINCYFYSCCCHTLQPLSHLYTHSLSLSHTQALEKALKDARKLGTTTSNSSSRDDGGDEGPSSAELADAIAQKIVASLLLQAQQIGAAGYKFTGMFACM
jgi:hypothetical protein